MSKPLDPIKPVNIHNIRIDGGTQSRAAINQEVVSEYAAALADGDYLPEIIVFFDGVDHWLGDGFHRLHAHLSLGKASIVAEIRKGTQRDAILFSLKANVVHGLRPNNEDKRKAVLTMLDDPEWCEMKDRAIARHCGCSHMTVARIRASLAEPETPEIGTSAKNAPAEIGTSASPQAAAPVPAVVTSAKKQAEEKAKQIGVPVDQVPVEPVMHQAVYIPPAQTKITTESGSMAIETDMVWELADIRALPDECLQERFEQIKNAIAPWVNAKKKASIFNIPGVVFTKTQIVKSRVGR